MATNYPTASDVFPVIASTDTMNTAGRVHSVQHNNTSLAIVAIQNELGTNPSDGLGMTFATVKDRLNDMEGRLGDAPVFVGTTAPPSPVNNMVWLDTSNLA
jgi:hypothetical protein